MKEKHTRGMTVRESSTSYNTKQKHGNNKEAYTVGSNDTEKKVGFAEVFADITRRRALPEETSIHTVEITAIKIAMRKIFKKENKRLVIYTDPLISMLVIDNNKK